MSWMNMLLQTYENNAGVVGMSGEDVLLAPAAHMVANANVEIMIDRDGNFVDARIVAKENAKTIIPVTEKSAGRSSGVAPHALCDMLPYVAGDFAKYTDAKTGSKAEEKFKQYVEALKKWVSSDYTHPKAIAVYNYIVKKEMVKDLIGSGIIICEAGGRFSSGKVSGASYDKVLVRFIVFDDDEECLPGVWEDKTLLGCYTDYYLSSQPGEKDMCYLTGEESTISVNHPKGIVAANYGAKLVSANDTAGFTFRGRFQNAEQACTLSYEASQKIHSALTWLAAKQGVFVGNTDKRTYICWNPKGKEVIDLGNQFEIPDDEYDETAHTEPEFKKKLGETFAGYADKLEDNDDIVVIGLDAATTGRLSITYYNELKASDFLERIHFWDEHCVWYYNHFRQDGKMEQVVQTALIKNMVKYAFGTQQGKFIDVNDKVLKEQSQRLMHCMLDQQKISRDIIHALMIKASTPLAYTKGNRERILSTACAAIKLYQEYGLDNQGTRGGVKMELDNENNNRSYLFGRLLAIAEYAEKITYTMEDSRETNAIRLQAAFVNHPAQVWKNLETQLIPYYQKRPGAAEKLKKLTESIIVLFRTEDIAYMNMPLDENYLFGYYLQRKQLRENTGKKLNEEVDKEDK